MKQAFFLFDHYEAERSEVLVVRYELPFASPASLDEGRRREWEASSNTAEFSHSLQLQVGGQIDAGFVITGFYDDSWSDEATLLNRFSPVAIATRSVKPTSPLAGAAGRSARSLRSDLQHKTSVEQSNGQRAALQSLALELEDVASAV